MHTTGTMYVLYLDSDASRERSRRALTLLLAVMLGVGSHASKESLAPAEPVLEGLGLGEQKSLESIDVATRSQQPTHLAHLIQVPSHMRC